VVIFYLFIFVTGLFIGSFLGVLVDRLPKKRQIISGRSSCEFCSKELEWYELIPVVSFVLQRGKCKKCRHDLSLFYPAIELTTGILFAITYMFLIQNSEISIQDLSFYLFIVSSLIVIFFTDLKYGIIPNKIIFSAILVTLVWSFINNSLIVNHLLTATFASLFLIVISLLYYFIRKKESLGGGDIKMAFLMGLVLGFPDIVTAFYIAFLTGAAYSLILILWGKLKLKDAIPFGPFLVLGTLISLFLGEQILSFILPLLGL
jgi:leader peptidase (prepilin peptidase) / N-methyltransferase